MQELRDPAHDEVFIGMPTGLAAFLRAQGQLLKTGLGVREAMMQLAGPYDSHPVD